MAQADKLPEEQDHTAATPARGRRWATALGVLAGLLIIALAVLYFSRERLARGMIEDQLAQLDLPATYDIGEIGPERQTIENLVIGDPAAPDLVVERVELEPSYGWGTPQIGRITLVRPRLFAGWKDGRPSFGSLDPLIYAESDEPPGLPALDIELVDGRALLESPYGPVGFKVAGAGRLDGGFSGILAAAAPSLAIQGCAARGVTLYGKLAVTRGQPGFTGPLRFAGLQCDGGDYAFGKGAFELAAEADEDLAGGELTAVGQAANLAAAGQNARMASLTSAIAFRGGRLTADYDAQLRGVSAAGATLDMLTAKGVVRGSDGFDRLEMQARVEGSGLRGGNGLERALGEVASASEGTLAAPLIARLRGGLRRELRGGSFALDAVVRRTGSVISGVVPQARLRGATGTTLLALSRVQFSTAGQGAPRFSANLATGGTDLPRFAGRMEQRASGAPVFRLQMAEYRAGNAALAIPELAISQDAAGAYLFSGRITASGPLPGGFAQDLRVPIDGRWADGDELVLWRGCTPVTFGRLQYADLALAGQSVTLCPPPGSAIVSRTGGALRIAAGLPSLDLSGRLGETPIVLRSGAVGFAYPGAVAVSQAEVTLGPADSAARFLIGDLTAEFGEDIAGTFDRADISIAAVPLDLRETRGNWRYADGRLTIGDAAFTLTDREEIDRFEPLAGRGASLSLQDNMILAQAVLHAPASGRDIVAVDIRHDLSAGTGSADLDVAGITFDAALQPDDLSYLAKGVIANARGVVTGGGEVEWNAAGVTSRGAFSSDKLDFAAAFGPVSGASGTVEFTDLIGLTTAPGQRITVDSVNPGIVVGQGAIEFQLRNGELLDVEGGTLTFAGGDLIVRPLQMRIGRAEERRYLFEVRGLDASLFIERLELNNIAATGLFDGQLPLIFDAEGNGRIEEGLLVSRPPGGNISYVGELTYEDLGAMANFAFDALRSLDYGKMTVLMDGPLTGELVTRVEIDGVSQGEGAKRNIITRQLGKIPLQFRINIRASFSKLIGTFASMSDPALVPGLSDRLIRTEDGLRLRRSVLDEVLEEAGTSDENSGTILENIPSEEPVQGQESDQSP